MTHRFFGMCAFAVGTALTACAPVEPQSTAPNGEPRIASVHAQKCRSCHTLPAAKTRSRPYLEEALSRHRKRVRLTEDVWRAMIDYLATPPDVATVGRASKTP